MSLFSPWEQNGLEGRRKKPAVDEDILAGDVAGMRRAEEGADAAELFRRAEPARGDRGDLAVDDDVDVLTARRGPGAVAGGQPIRVHLARKEVVDRDIAVGNLPRDARQVR